MRKHALTLVVFALLFSGCPDQKPKGPCQCEDTSEESPPKPVDTGKRTVDCGVDTGTKGVATTVTIDSEWTEDACGGIDLKINQFDESNGWVYLAYRLNDVGYSDKMPYQGKKATRAALIFPDSFVGIRTCSDGSCTLVCQKILE